MKHVISVEKWATQWCRDVPNKGKAFSRWSCSCGRLGPALAIDGTGSSFLRAAMSAQRGGRLHAKAVCLEHPRIELSIR